MALASTGEFAHAGHMVIGATPAGMSAARKHVHSMAREHFSENEAQDILIAVGEALSNAYRHGTPGRELGLIYVDWNYRDNTLTVSVKDEGPACRRDRVSATEKSLGLGRGFDIISKTVDDFHIETSHGVKLVLKNVQGGDLGSNPEDMHSEMWRRIVRWAGFAVRALPESFVGPDLLSEPCTNRKSCIPPSPNPLPPTGRGRRNSPPCSRALPR